MRYKDRKVRELCHGVKVRNSIAINEMADYFISYGGLNEDSIIVPAPQHEGYAIYTKQIADIIAKETKAKVLDILKCLPHETLYRQKIKGRLIAPKFYLTERIEFKEALFLDNVMDTGTTFMTVNRLMQGKLKPLVYATV